MEYFFVVQAYDTFPLIRERQNKKPNGVKLNCSVSVIIVRLIVPNSSIRHSRPN